MVLNSFRLWSKGLAKEQQANDHRARLALSGAWAEASSLRSGREVDQGHLRHSCRNCKLLGQTKIFRSRPLMRIIVFRFLALQASTMAATCSTCRLGIPQDPPFRLPRCRTVPNNMAGLRINQFPLTAYRCPMAMVRARRHRLDLPHPGSYRRAPVPARH